MITLKGKTANAVYWSPTGRNLVLAGLKAMNGQLEFFNADEMETLATAEHFMCAGCFSQRLPARPTSTGGGAPPLRHTKSSQHSRACAAASTAHALRGDSFEQWAGRDSAAAVGVMSEFARQADRCYYAETDYRNIPKSLTHPGCRCLFSSPCQLCPAAPLPVACSQGSPYSTGSVANANQKQVFGRC